MILQEQQWDVWAAQAQKGDQNAYRFLLKEIAPFIRNAIVGSLANPDWADDITQDALISIHKSLKTYSPDKPFRPWMMAVVHFRRTDFLRKYYNKHKKQSVSLDDILFEQEFVTEAGVSGELKDIEAALGSVSEKQRRIFQLIKIEGYSADETAQKMGMSASAVKVSAHRTQKRLQDLLR